MKTIIKKIGLMFLFLQSIYISNAGNISFAPLNINLKGLEASGDTTIAFGDFGSALISCDNQKTWKQIRIFDTGNIIGVCLEKSRIVAFSDIGDVSISADGGKSWNKKSKPRRFACLCNKFARRVFCPLEGENNKPGQ